MSWSEWNKKQKKVFIISLIIIVLFIALLLFSLPPMTHRISTQDRFLYKFFGLIAAAGIGALLNAVIKYYQYERTSGHCVKCKKPCVLLYEKRSHIFYSNCSECGKNQC